MKTAHDIWLYINLIYGRVSNDDDDEPKEEVHEDVEHIYNTVIVEDCSTSWSSDDDDCSTTRSLDKIDNGGPSSSDAIDDSTQAHLMLIMMIHARDMKVMSLQALQHHHIASYHKMTLRYLLLMWLIVMIHVLSLFVNSLKL